MNKAEMLSRARALQRQASELVGMILALEEPALFPSSSLPRMPSENASEEKFLSAREVQHLLGIGESTFYEWLKAGRLPSGVQFGPKVRRWRRSDIERAAPAASR